MRKTKEELNEIMEKKGVNKLWSWSKINTFHISPYSYYLSYIKHITGDRANSIYATTGGLAHDILEKLYTGQIQYEEMDRLFEDAFATAYDISQLKFDRNDEEKNTKIADKYYEDLKHFFNHHTVIPHKTAIEQFVTIDIGGNVLQGYIDCCYKDDKGCYNVIDFKTSTIYKGDKALNESGQLVLYCMALHQMGVPYEKIIIAWNFLKYVTIEYQQANGTVKTREVERCKIGESLQSNVKMWLKKEGYSEDEVKSYLNDLMVTNSIDILPDDVKEKYLISDCYVEIPITPELIVQWTDYVITTIKDIELRETDYEKTKSDRAFWDDTELLKKQSYFHATLSEYSPNLHKPYAEYCQKLDAMKNEQDMFTGVGGENKVVVGENKTNDNDLSWLDEIV